MGITESASDASDYLRNWSNDSDKNLAIEAVDDAVIIELLLPPNKLKFRHSYVEPEFLKRARQPNQALLRACNNRQKNIHRVLDLTGGWGTDSFILAHHGQNVVMIEHNRLVYCIITHSLERARTIKATGIAADRIETIHAKALEYLQSLGKPEPFDCIYLDPMFPEHHSSAKPAKEMQILQYLTSNEAIDQCFELALQTATNRVVIKRPAKAPTMTDLAPDLVYREKTIRFDVYLTTACRLGFVTRT